MNLRFFYLADKFNRLILTDGCQHSIVHTIQQQLTKQGLYRGNMLGIWDAETKEALLKFQSHTHLPATGCLDPITYCHLFQCKQQLELTPIESKSRTSSAMPRRNILITKANRQLTLFNGNTPIRQFPVAIGKPSTPTPVGNFAVATKIVNPGGVLGSRWMGLNYDAYGIHGTNKPWLIGSMVSNGCIRMHNANAEEVFTLINVGTPVFIRD